MSGEVEYYSPEQLVSTPSGDASSQAISSASGAATAFLSFQEKINEVMAQLNGTGEGDGTEDDLFTQRVQTVIDAMLLDGDNVSALYSNIQRISWAYAQLKLFGGEDNAGILREEIGRVLPQAITAMILAEGDNVNALRKMYEDINMLIHGLHILGDNLIPHLEASLVRLEKRIASLEQTSIDPVNARSKARTTSTGTSFEPC